MKAKGRWRGGGGCYATVGKTKLVVCDLCGCVSGPSSRVFN